MEFLTDVLRVLLPYGFAFLVIYLFKNQISKVLLPRVQSVKLGELEITFLKEAVKKITAERVNKTLSDEDATGPLLRANMISPVLDGARLLWIDDKPDGNTGEMELLRKLGITVDAAVASEEARQMLSKFHYDVIISDIDREGRSKEGLTFLESLIGTRLFRYTIFYVHHVDEDSPIPKGAFNITNQPDKLLHLIMDALERERWQALANHGMQATANSVRSAPAVRRA
jgi:CheY-like chemotaxis protein